MNKKKLIIATSVGLVGAIALAVVIPFTILGIRTASLKNDYSYLFNDENYSSNVGVAISLKKQDVSCGYAVIEMMSEYYGNKVDEIELSKRNEGAITTSSSNGFLKEINKTITNKEFIKKSYLKYDVLLKEIHDSLKNNNPVAIEWAAQYEGNWTLHYSVISAMDLLNDDITIYNPYGYTEDITTKDFLERSSFKAYKNMGFLSFGFAYGAFEKNTIFYAK